MSQDIKDWTAGAALAQAHDEIQHEQWRLKVDHYKAQMRAARWWHKLIPFTITIRRREP
jgi:hypothetical protein